MTGSPMGGKAKKRKNAKVGKYHSKWPAETRKMPLWGNICI